MSTSYGRSYIPNAKILSAYLAYRTDKDHITDKISLPVYDIVKERFHDLDARFVRYAGEKSLARTDLK